MINWLFRLFLAFNSTSLLLVVYWIKSGVTLSILPPSFHIPNYVSYLIYIIGMLLLTYLSLLCSKLLGKDSMNNGDIEIVEYANDAFLPSYLGYFFVALDVPNVETLCFVYPLVFVFTFLSQTLYFNPLFLVFGYHFYNLTTANNVRVFMITKKKFKNPKTISFPSLKRINDFTFIDNEEL
jgi:hypothetical protein